MLTVAAITVSAAQLREESRGVHLRTDFPHVDNTKWNCHLVFQRDSDGEIRTSKQEAGRER